MRKGVNMSADTLYDNIRGYLRLSTRVIGDDEKISVGDNFTVRFTATNQAYAANRVKKPRIIFLNPRIFIEGTEFAQPVQGNDWHDLPDTTLFPGESTYVDITFTATSDMGGLKDFLAAEKIATAWITANLDQDAFFQIWNSDNIRQEIKPT
jgi:hypothetical protein